MSPPRLGRFAQAIRDPRGGPNDHPRQVGYDLQNGGAFFGQGSEAGVRKEPV